MDTNSSIKKIKKKESANQFQFWIWVFSIMGLDMCDFEIICDIGKRRI